MKEPKLRALIKEDLKLHPNSKISEIYKRMGDFDLKYLRRIIYKMYDETNLMKSLFYRLSYFYICFIERQKSQNPNSFVLFYDTLFKKSGKQKTKLTNK